MDYSYIIIPIIVLITSQALKLATDGIKGNFDLRNLFISYGGMPSSHSALVTSLATIVYLLEGFSVAFAISAILAVIIMRDAIGLRGLLSSHGRILNKLIKDLPDEEEYKYPVMEETVAHTISQIAVGAILGVIITFLLF